MKTIHVDEITAAVKEMCMKANTSVSEDVYRALQDNLRREKSEIGKAILSDILSNAAIAQEHVVPTCQDTGMAVFFVALGQAVTIAGGGLTDAINQGVREGYRDGFLRKSIVADPLRRQNTKDNTPSVIHYDVVEGDHLSITFCAKGFGSENMSRAAMLKPSDGVEGVVNFVVDTVKHAGPNACPPLVVGVGIGGTLDKAAQIAKKALNRQIGSTHQDPYYRDLESRLLTEINKLGIGPQGLGGTTTALAVQVAAYPTHIAGLPVVVNINCHASRHLDVTW